MAPSGKIRRKKEVREFAGGKAKKNFRMRSREIESREWWQGGGAGLVSRQTGRENPSRSAEPFTAAKV